MSVSVPGSGSESGSVLGLSGSVCGWRTFAMSSMWRRDCKYLSRFHVFSCGHAPRSAHGNARVEELCARVAVLLDVFLSRARVRPALSLLARIRTSLVRLHVHTGPAKR